MGGQHVARGCRGEDEACGTENRAGKYGGDRQALSGGRVDVRWELNPGNHFRDVAMRSAKGIKAILEA